MLNFML